jgi:ribose-phosphate pyrophosphokinase
MLFALDATQPLFAAISALIQTPLSAHEERVFDDGEVKIRPLVDPGGRDVVLLQSLHGSATLSPHDRLFRLWAFAATLRDHGAARVTAVVPYLAYARKDRRTRAFDPLTLKYLASHVECAGIDRLIALEVHEPAAFENAFRIPVVQVPAVQAFGDLIQGSDAPWVIASPDPGGVKRALLWQESLGARPDLRPGFAFLDKRRSAGVLSSQDLLAGDVRDARVVLYDDLIASGETMVHAARVLRAHGAVGVTAAAAHALFTGHASRTLCDPALERIVVTDSIPGARVRMAAPLESAPHRLQVVSVAPLLAKAIAALSR